MKLLNKILMTALSVFLFIPLLSMLLWAFFASWSKDAILPSNFTLRWMQYFWTSGDWMIGAKSVIFSVGVALVSIILSIMISRFLMMSSFRYKEQLESLFYLPMLLPVVGVCIGSHKMFLNLKLSGSLVVFILHIYFALPYAFRMVYSYYQVWGMEQEQIARGLGATSWKAFLKVNLPLYLGGYLTGFIMAFIISYSQYFVNFFIGDYRSVNFSMIMTPYISGSDRNLASVYTLLYMMYGIAVMVFCAAVEKIYNKRNGYELFKTGESKL